MNDLYRRASAVFGAGSDGVFWPYDVSGIDQTLRKRDPEKFQRTLARREMQREVIVEWAERHGLKTSSVKCCPWWLTRTNSRRCSPDQCTRYGMSGATSPDSLWLDHGIYWIKDGKPAVITSAPYHLEAEDQARIDRWTAEHPNLKTVQGSGWYGFTTRQVILWRSDRIAHVVPAELPSGFTALL